MGEPAGLLRLGLGKSINRSSQEAGREAALRALERLNEKPDCVIAFSTGGYTQQHILESISAVIGPVPMSGCSASGVFTPDGPDESTHALAVLAICSPKLQFSTFRVPCLAQDPARCAQDLSARIRADSQGEDGLLLLFPDGVTGNITRFLHALQQDLPSGIAVAGGTSGELLRQGHNSQFLNGTADSDSVACVLIRGDFTPEIAVSHGCEPIGKEQVVTKAGNGWIYEIDGEPAWSVYNRYLDYQPGHSFTMGDSCFICLAEHLPEPDPRYGEYIIRCPLQLDEAKGALFFPGDIQKGTKVRMALRNIERTVNQAMASAKAIMSRHPGVKPELVLQFDCCCRGQLLFGSRSYELLFKPLREAFGSDVPWFGFSTYGEIAPLPGNKSFFHNYSTVLCAIFPKNT